MHSLRICAVVGVRSLLAIAGLLCVTGAASADALHDKQNGLWGTPNCTDPTIIYAAASDLYLTWGRADNAWTVSFTLPIEERLTDSRIIEQYKFGTVYSITYTWFADDKLLTASASAPGNPETKQDLKTVPDEAPANAEVVTYERCTTLPSNLLLHAEGVRFMEFATGVKKNCVGAAAPVCINYVFSFIDVSKDQKLSVAELSRMIRIGVYAAIAAAPEGATQDKVSGSFALSTVFAPVVASSIVSSMDYNADGQLSLQEILYDHDLSNMTAQLNGMNLDAVGSTVSTLLNGMKNLPSLLH